MPESAAYWTPMVHCSAMREAMKDTGNWVGSKWGSVKQSGVTAFFCNPQPVPSPLPRVTPSPTYLPPISLCVPLL